MSKTSSAKNQSTANQSTANQSTAGRSAMSQPAIQALLHGLFDYAGLFPPAKLSMETVVENYARYRSVSDAWILGNLVVPASRLKELSRAVNAIPSARQSSLNSRWPLTVLCHDIGQELPLVDLVRTAESDRFEIASIETKHWQHLDHEHLYSETGHPLSTPVYGEVSWDAPAGKTFTEVKQHGLRGKIRCGGLVAEAFPSARQLDRGLRQVIAENLAIKATAGLHHVFPSRRPASGEPDAPIVPMHGFVNLMLAITLIEYHQCDETEIIALLTDTAPSHFSLNDNSVNWKRRTIPADKIALMREHRFHSIGSCSFEEPLTELTDIGWLESHHQEVRN